MEWCSSFSASTLKENMKINFRYVTFATNLIDMGTGYRSLPYIFETICKCPNCKERYNYLQISKENPFALCRIENSKYIVSMFVMLYVTINCGTVSYST